MSSSKVVPEDAKAEFWAVVGDCLREFHGMSPRKAGKLRSAVERMPAAQMELFYHSEPFDVACEIAHEPLNFEECLDRYLRIRDEKHGNGTSKQVVHPRRKASVKR